MRFQKSTSRSITLFVFLAVFSACGNDNALAPQFEPELVNLQDSFSFQTTGITDITQILSYNWENTGISANVDQACSISAGSATLAVMDSQGTTVYTRNLSDGGSFQTSSGVAGTWTIRVTLAGTTGTLNFSLQKRTP